METLLTKVDSDNNFELHSHLIVSFSLFKWFGRVGCIQNRSGARLSCEVSGAVGGIWHRILFTMIQRISCAVQVWRASTDRSITAKMPCFVVLSRTRSCSSLALRNCRMRARHDAALSSLRDGYDIVPSGSEVARGGMKRKNVVHRFLLKTFLQVYPRKDWIGPLNVNSSLSDAKPTQ